MRKLKVICLKRNGEVRQERLDFETDEPEEAVVLEEEKPKKRGRKKQIEAPAPLDATA